MRGHKDFVDAVGWSPDGTRLASAGLDSSVRIWDPRTGEETLVLRGASGMFHDLSWNSDGAQLAAACSDGQVWIWVRDPPSHAIWPIRPRAETSSRRCGSERFRGIDDPFARRIALVHV